MWYDPSGADSKSDLTLALEADENKHVTLGEEEDRRQQEHMEMEEAIVAHDAHMSEAKKLAGGTLHEDHAALLAELMKTEQEGNGNNAGMHETVQTSFNGDGRGSDHREVLSNAAKATQRGDRIVRGHLRVFPAGDVSELDRFVPPTLGEGIPRGRFSFLNPHGNNFRGGGRHGVEYLPVQVKLAVFVMVLGMCVAIIASGGGKRKRQSERNKGV